MIPYLAMIGIPSLLGLSGDRRLQGGYVFAFIFLLFVAIIGFRYQVGPDWFNYAKMVDDYQTESFADLSDRGEVGWVALVKISNALGFGMAGVVFVGAIVFCIGLFAIARITQEPMLAIVSATPYLAVAVAMSGIRQSIALGIIYFLIGRWHNMTIPVKIALTIFASLFHFSAILMILFISVDSKLEFSRKIVIGTIVTAICLYSLSTETFRVDRYSSNYLSGENSVDAPGAILHVLLIAIPAAVYFSFRKRWNQVYGRNILLDVFSLASVMSLVGVAISPAATDRMSLYFSPAAMIIQAGLPMTRGGEGEKTLFRIVIIAANLAAMAVFLFAANHSRSFLPYASVFSQDAKLGRPRQ